MSSDFAVLARFELCPRIVSASWRSRSISAPCRVASRASRSSSAARAATYCDVRAAVLDELAVVQVQHAGDRRVEQVEVVAHDEQRAAVLAEEADEPFLRVVVEVVGRLVEEQELAAGEQDARELDPAPLATGERVDREVEPALGEPEPGRDAPHLGLRRVPAGVAELLLGPGELGDVLARTAYSSIRSRSFSTRCAAASRPRPESTWERPVLSTPEPRVCGFWGR